MKKPSFAKTARIGYEEAMLLSMETLPCATIAIMTATVTVTDAEDSYIMMMHITKTIPISHIAESAMR